MRAVRRLVMWARCGTTSLAARAVRHMSSADAVKSSRLSKFHTLDIPGRVSTLEKAGFLTPETSAALRGQGLALDDANNMIENVLATFGVPMGVALNMTVNGKDYVVPMVLEEPSVVAAVGNVARMTRPEGFTATSDDPVMIGQIHIREVPDMKGAKATLEANFAKLTDMANEIQPRLLKRGGGMRGMEVKELVYDEPGEAREETLVLNFFMDCRDAMGANMINTTAEHLAPYIEALTHAKACVSIPLERLATATLEGREVAEGIAGAYRFAYADPYRACTHNKGVMNGIDPVIIATGNDWRAIEAGAHAYAARDGRYKPLASWKISGDRLQGHIALPMQVGVVGGTIKNHPTAKAALAMLEVAGAQELGEVIAAVGLAQNLAALRALATEGIQRGHMSMHARSLVARVLPDASEEMRAKVLSELIKTKDVKEARVLDIYGALSNR